VEFELRGLPRLRVKINFKLLPLAHRHIIRAGGLAGVDLAAGRPIFLVRVLPSISFHCAIQPTVRARGEQCGEHAHGKSPRRAQP